MRVLVTFIGGFGHFQPMVPVARALAAAGHQVAVAGAGVLVRQVEAAGFTALPTSPIRASAVTERDLTPLEPVDARASEREFATNFADKGARRHAAALQEHIRSWDPDVVVRDEADLGSAPAAEVLGIPTATVLVLAAGLLIRPELVSPPLEALRAEYGLPPDPRLSMVTGGLILSPFPASFRSPDSPLPLPPTTCYFRAEDDIASSKPRGGRRRVYASLGTVFNSGSGDLFERLLAGLAEVDADVLVTVGRTIDPSGFGPQPAHVTIERFRPQSEALLGCDVAVTHGGSGSLLAALTHGVRSVVLPLGADQPHNAERAEQLGLARSLDAASATSEGIRRCVEQVLDDQAMRERVGRVAGEIAEMAPITDAVTRLEALGAGQG